MSTINKVQEHFVLRMFIFWNWDRISKLMCSFNEVVAFEIIEMKAFLFTEILKRLKLDLIQLEF